MATINSTGDLSGLIYLTNGAMDDALIEAFDYFANNFDWLIYDVFTGNGDLYAITETYMHLYSYSTDGVAELFGSSFISGMSGRLTQVNFTNGDGSFTAKGSATWNANYGTLTGSFTSIESHSGDSGLILEGRMNIDAYGYLTGTINRQVTILDDVRVEYIGNMSASDLSGTVTKVILADNSGNSVTVTGNYQVPAFQAVLDVTNNADEVLDTASLFSGADTFTVTDGTRAWHGFGGADKITGGAQSDTLMGDDANDTLYGMGGMDALIGGAGDDILDGGADDDYYEGGTGNDKFIVDDSNETVFENPGEGTDLISTSVTFDMAFNAAFVENLIMTGTANIDALGNDLVNSLTGNSGNNILDGGIGADKMNGGAGNDTYIVDNAGDTITDQTGTADTVRTSISFTIGTGIENLELDGAAGAINGTGNTGVNTITGNSAVNTLDGGSGNDTLIGGDGDDIYIVNSAQDVIIEGILGGGNDTVRSSVTFTLGAFTEHLVLTGSMGNAIGNGGGNSLTGNSGANTLDGGAGMDDMRGNDGNDTYIVDNIGDTVTETNAATTQMDTVRSAIDYVLGANLENLVLTGMNLIGTGNGLKNTITGGAGNDTIDGMGGADKMSGGLGDDIYYTDNLQDSVTEVSGAGSGNDRVFSEVNFTLGAYVERLTLTGAALKGTGGNDANIIDGNANANTLSGMGGNDTLDGQLGADILTGGMGGDSFVFDGLTMDGSSDTVTDFNRTQGDKLVLEDMLVGYVAGVSTLQDFVQIVSSGSDSLLQVDRDGSGIVFGFQTIATLTRTSGLTDETALLNAGTLVVS